MDKELFEKGEFKLKIEGGNLYLVFDSKGVDVTLKIEGAYFLDKLAEAIPGEIDDAVIAMLKGAMKV